MTAPDSKRPKVKRMTPYTPRWRALERQILSHFAPHIYPCQHCGAPVADGYCCTFCRSDDPRSDA